MPAEPGRPGQLTRVETACAELAAAGQPVTFREIAARAQISRTTLYRRDDLHAVVDEHRARGRDATALSGLAVQVDQMRHSLEEQLRLLQRARREPG